MEYILVCLIGGTLYSCIELLWRGWTHWSMALCGGTCFTLMYLVSGLGLPLYKKCILSTAVIAAIEFITGCIVNLKLNWGIWDYSDLPYNLLGQICPQFLIMWLFLTVPGIMLCKLLRRIL